MPAMKTFPSRLIPVLVLYAIPVALPAQSPDYPTGGVPKLADGKPNLKGPVPKPRMVIPTTQATGLVAGPRPRDSRIEPVL